MLGVPGARCCGLEPWGTRLWGAEGRRAAVPWRRCVGWEPGAEGMGSGVTVGCEGGLGEP